MSLVTLNFKYSDEKLAILKNHYQTLLEFLKTRTEDWDKFCLQYERRIFFFPYNLCLQMKQLCAQIVAKFDEDPAELSKEILASGRKIIEIENNQYKELGRIANECIKDGGFSYGNLKDMYFRWDEAAAGEHATDISFSREVPNNSGNSHHDDFMDLFCIGQHLLDPHYENAHQMLEQDADYTVEVPVPVQQQNGPAWLARQIVVTENGYQVPPEAIHWDSDYDAERRRFVDAAHRTENFPEELRRSVSLNSSLVTLPTPDTSFDEDDFELPYIKLEDGEFDVFDEFMMLYNAVCLAEEVNTQNALVLED